MAMAEYQQQQQLQNEDKLPFTPEYDVEYEGGPDSKLRFDNCEKNPGHPNFIPVKQFKMEDLPERHRTDEVMDMVKTVSERTVRVVVKYVSRDRPDDYPNNRFRGTTRKRFFGTGYQRETVKRVENKPCLCHDCRYSRYPEMGYLEVVITTATHVVFDDSEAKRTVVEFGYDSEERNEVITLDGVYAFADVDEKGLKLDMSYLFCVTHDTGLYEKLSNSAKLLPKQKWQGLPLPFIVSHPHGRSKHITIGCEIHLVSKLVVTNRPSDSLFTCNIRSGRKCRLSKSNWATSLELFQQLIGLDTPCEPGVWYGIREGVTISSNHLDAKYRDLLKEDDEDLRFFVKFHPDVEFRWSSGSESHLNSFPDVEFDMLPEDDPIFDESERKKILHYQYNIASCPGSSGASVCGGEFYNLTVRHAGSDDTNRMNRTGRFSS